MPLKECGKMGFIETGIGSHKTTLLDRLLWKIVMIGKVTHNRLIYKK